MPAHMLAHNEGASAPSDYTIVPPGHITPVEIHDPADGSEHVLAVACDDLDWVSRVFVFPRPEQLRDLHAATTDELLTYCTEETAITTLGHDDAVVLAASSDPESPARVTIVHDLAMSAS